MKFDAPALRLITGFFVIEILVMLLSSTFFGGLVTYILVVAFSLATISIVFRIARRQMLEQIRKI